MAQIKGAKIQVELSNFLSFLARYRAQKMSVVRATSWLSLPFSAFHSASPSSPQAGPNSGPPVARGKLMRKVYSKTRPALH